MLARLIILACSLSLVACSHHHTSPTPTISLNAQAATRISINNTVAAVSIRTPLPTIARPTPQPYTYSPDTYQAQLASCHSDPNGSTFNVVGTTRRFITIPRAIYPDGAFIEVSGTASGGYISNGGLPGYAKDGNADCWSTYYEFDGEGGVDFVAKSVLPGAPDYILHFIVTGTP